MPQEFAAGLRSSKSLTPACGQPIGLDSQHVHLATALVQYIVQPGTCEDAQSAALEALRGLQPKDVLGYGDTDAGSAVCVKCGGFLFGQAWQVRHLCCAIAKGQAYMQLPTLQEFVRGPGKLAVAENLHCISCCKPGMKLHRLLTKEELESCMQLLSSTAITGFCTNYEQVCST